MNPSFRSDDAIDRRAFVQTPAAFSGESPVAAARGKAALTRLRGKATRLRPTLQTAR